MENPRQIRGFAILAQPNTIRQVSANTFKVRSQSNPQVEYVVTNGKEFSCSCPDQVHRKLVCKDVWAVRSLISLKNKPDPSSIIEITKEVLEAPTGCPKCNSTAVKQRGVRKNQGGSLPRYFCRSCGHWFVVDEGFATMRHDAKIITLVLDSYFRGLSARKIQEQLWQFYGLRVHHQTVFNWIKRFIPEISKWMDNQIHSTSTMWHVDEMAVKIGGADKLQNWIWNVLDRETRYLLASEVTGTRTTDTAKHVLRKARIRAITNYPEVIVTDKLAAYLDAIRDSFVSKNPTYETEAPFHLRKPRFVDRTNNNLVERLNGSIREREKVLRAFKKQGTAQAIMDGWRVYYNLVRKHQTLNARPADLALGVNMTSNNRWLELIKKSHAELKC
jgi:putative transposase